MVYTVVHCLEQLGPIHFQPQVASKVVYQFCSAAFAGMPVERSYNPIIIFTGYNPEKETGLVVQEDRTPTSTPTNCPQLTPRPTAVAERPRTAAA